MTTTETSGPIITEESVPVWNGRLTIRVKVAGAGAPVLYLHPAAGLAWDPFLSHLAHNYTVYAPEFPGTSVGDPYAIHAVDHLSDVVLMYEEVVRTLGLRKPVVVGQSFGGMLAAELTAAFPELASKVVLLDPIGLWRDDLPVASWIATPPDHLPALLFHDPSGAAAQSMLALPDDPDIAAAAIAGMVWAFGGDRQVRLADSGPGAAVAAAPSDRPGASRLGPAGPPRPGRLRRRVGGRARQQPGSDHRGLRSHPPGGEADRDHRRGRALPQQAVIRGATEATT